jgi:glycine oxidase
LCTAYELLRRGQRVVVFEANVPGAGATQAAGGMLAPTCEAETAEPQVVALGKDSLARYPEFVAQLLELTGVDCEYQTQGTLWVAFSQDDWAELTHVRARLLHKGIRTELLDAPEVLQREPYLSPRVLGALWVPTDHQVEPRALTQALVKAIHQLGGELKTGVQVDAVMHAHGKVTGVRIGDATVKADQVVIAAGAHSSALLHEVMPREVVRPVKGQIVRVRGAKLLSHVIRSPDVYVIPRQNGDVLLGATVEEQGFDTTPTAGAVLDMLRFGWRAVPGLYDMSFVECAVGLRPALADHVPRIGATAINGLFVATGHYRDGILLGPATGFHLAELMTTGVMPDALLPFAVVKTS